tara:strand:+ start:44 stop:562 length:519 start_codon:yes stop_codon:yes gene_type:complete
MISSFYTVPDVLTSTDCDEIINYCTDKCEPSNVTDGSKPNVRNSVNTFFAPDELPITKKVLDCVVQVCHEIFNFPVTNVEPIQYAEYTEGMYYDSHVDSGETLELDRDISVSVFLTPRDEYEEGNLSFWYPNGWVDVNEQQGSLVVFSSMLPHKVKKVEKGKRSSLVLWCRR